MDPLGVPPTGTFFEPLWNGVRRDPLAQTLRWDSGKTTGKSYNWKREGRGCGLDPGRRVLR